MELELYRNNKLERKIDLYRLLLHRDSTDNIGLKNKVLKSSGFDVKNEFE